VPRLKFGLQIATLTLTSRAFSNGGPIPVRHTCDGDDVSPPLDWGGAPQDTRSFVVMCEDEDAGLKPWVHWIMFNIGAGWTKLSEDVPKAAAVPGGAVQARNDFGEIGYGGPCPPSGTHRYTFRLYAVDKMLDLKSSATREDVLKAIDGHVVGQAELMGTRDSGKK
jgi:Raf kinase inhibitor-like YbhB/YbcL family protein